MPIVFMGGIRLVPNIDPIALILLSGIVLGVVSAGYCLADILDLLMDHFDVREFWRWLKERLR